MLESDFVLLIHPYQRGMTPQCQNEPLLLNNPRKLFWLDLALDLSTGVSSAPARYQTVQ